MQLGGRIAVVVAAGLVALVSACGGGTNGAITPAAPSGVGPGPGTGAVIAGRVNTTATASASTAAGAPGASGISTRDASSITVTIVGTAITTTTNGAGDFTLTGVPEGTVELRFTGPGTNAMITVAGLTTGDRIELTVTLTTSGSARVESERRSKSSNGMEVNGLVTGVDLAARTLQVGTTLVIVPTGAVIRHGGTSLQIADIQVGDRVQVKGVREGGVVTASEVKVEDQSDNGRSGSDAEVEGIVRDLAGSCPSLTFRVGTTRVATSAATRFKDGACAGLREGSVVEVKGSRVVDGTIVASEVEQEDDDDDDDGPGASQVALDGTISGLAGVCPAVSFRVKGTTVETSAATTFRDPCSRLANGAKVEVKGVRGGSGEVTASRVSLDD